MLFATIGQGWVFVWMAAAGAAIGAWYAAMAALRRAVEGLSTGERALFYRKYYYLQSTAQIAAELGTTERAVEGRLYRLRRRLRDAMGGEDDA